MHVRRVTVRPYAVALLLASTSAQARELLGVYDGWAAFRDVQPRRCYAIAKPDKHSGAVGRDQPYLTIADWPERGIRGQVHVRLSQPLPGHGKDLALVVDGTHFPLVGGGVDAWAPDAAADAAIIVAMRSGRVLSVGRYAYSLRGAASAIDAARLGCIRGG